MTDHRRPPASDVAPPSGAAPDLRWSDELTKAPSRWSIVHSPIRLAFAIGAVIMFVGALLPWAEGMIGFLPVQFGGFQGAADGLILAALAIVALLFARSQDFLYAVDGMRRWAPMLLGLACVGLWLLGFQAAQMTIAGWVEDDGHGSMVIGYWIAGIGVGILAIVGSYASLRYHEGQTSDPLGFVRRPRRTDAGPILAWIGGIAGLFIGAIAALEIFPPISASAPMVFMAGFGMILGAYLGRTVGGAIGRSGSRG
jgi:hypothetical protein